MSSETPAVSPQQDPGQDPAHASDDGQPPADGLAAGQDDGLRDLVHGAADGGDASAGTEARPASDPAEHRFECRSCGYVYDPAEGVRKLGIGPGTPFADLDALTFRCPVCRSKVAAFRDIGPRDKPSGFEENLNFGLGVNRLTPGQKNVLIFGGFALAIAFFLSLYSLR